MRLQDSDTLRADRASGGINATELPGYSPRSTSARHDTASRSSGTSEISPPNLQASNFQIVKHKMPIDGTFIIDPSLEVPSDFFVENKVPPNTTGSNTVEKNLLLECTRGSINVDIWLVKEKLPTEGARKMDVGRAVLDVHCKSWLGKVDVKMYSISAHPFTLTASSFSGDVSIALPSNFVGPVTLNTGSLYDSFRPNTFAPLQGVAVPASTKRPNTSVSFSDKVKSQLVTFSEVGGKRTCFIGNFRTANFSSMKDWTGSVVHIQSGYGNLKVSFVDEPQEQIQNAGCVVM